ncbi:MAG: hypothetical protein H8E38_05545 [SAR324 cluster bacterium]|nr:hypothetical protein [SAR324 cluster bacterium]MBL7034168.1 hypothetical protein [SAR324 cluster bacterium]
MNFSAYQIESLLDDFQENIFPIAKSASETLNLSEGALQDAREYFRPQTVPTLDWILPKDMVELVEDQTDFEPVVDFVQQSRAGRFVVPAYIPENPAPAFTLVSDYSQSELNRDTEEMELQQVFPLEKDDLSPDLEVESDESEDDFSVAVEETFVTEGEELQLETEISVSEYDLEDENTKLKSTEYQEEIEATDVTGETAPEPEDSVASTKEESADGEPEVSAAALFEGLDEDDAEDDFEIDEGGLQGEIDDNTDVVFGDGRIDLKSMSKFVGKYPDSTIKFLLRKNLDGRPLPTGYEEIYLLWEDRGLTRGRLKKYLFQLMEWNDFPDIPVHDVVKKIRERQFELKMDS